jgi:hypothetical protein
MLNLNHNLSKSITHWILLGPHKSISVYVDSDAVHLYRAGKACGWHAGVLAAPTVL